MSSRPDCIFEIHQLWQSGFRKVYSNSCCSCSFEHGIIKIGQSSHKMYSNKILSFHESTTILNSCTKKVWKLIESTTYLEALCSALFIDFSKAFNSLHRRKMDQILLVYDLLKNCCSFISPNRETDISAGNTLVLFFVYILSRLCTSNVNRSN